MDTEPIPMTPGLESVTGPAEPAEGAALHCSACGASSYYPQSVNRRCPVCGGGLDDVPHARSRAPRVCVCSLHCLIEGARRAVEKRTPPYNRSANERSGGGAFRL